MSAGQDPENKTTRSTAATGNGSDERMDGPMFDDVDRSARPSQPAPQLSPSFLEAVLSPDTLTPAPCSLTWCDLGEVHDFTSHAMRPGDGLERFHELTLKGDSPLTVTVSALEHLDDEGITLADPTISMEDSDGREYTAGEARMIAAALLVAAARLDEIEGAR